LANDTPDHSDPITAADVAGALTRLRAQAPRVHCLTNAVAQAFTANVLLALGAVPSMTIAREEVPSFVAGAGALLVNLGTLDPARNEAIEVALDVVGDRAIPWVLDPVFADVSAPRLDVASFLLKRGPTVLRANERELAALAGGDVGEAALRAKTTIARTGAVDVVTDGTRTAWVDNGSAMLTKITATGCAAGAVVGAFLAVEPDPVVAATAALTVFGVAAEIAGETAAGPGSFAVALLDALYSLDEAILHEKARLT